MTPPAPEREEVRITRVSVSTHAWISAEELAAAAEVSLATLSRIVRLGLLQPAAAPPREFPAASVSRLRRMLRLHHDLGVNLEIAAVMAELVERVERLEAELARARGEG